MTPLDDELRSTLRRHADQVVPAVDPLAGIERRARGLQRRRIAAGVVGSTLVISLMALSVPALLPSGASESVGPAATSPVLPEPTGPAPSAPTPSAFSLDDPWDYRGSQDLLRNGNLELFTQAVAADRGLSPDRLQFIPLFGDVARGEGRLVFAARTTGSEGGWYGVVWNDDGRGRVADVREVLPATTAMVLSGPGAEVPSLDVLIVASPTSRLLEYAADGKAFVPLERRTAGAGRIASGPPYDVPDAVRVTGADGTFTYDGPGLRSGATSPPPVATDLPDNLLGWPARGITDQALVERAVKGFATAKGVARSQVSARVLFAGDNDPGQRYVLVQAWVKGKRAQVFGWIETPGRDPEPVLRPITAAGTPLVALLLTEIPGRTTDELVLVAAPSSGEISYRATPSGPLRPVSVDGLEGIALVDRVRGAAKDQVVLIGQGTDARPDVVDDVPSLLCGQSGCG